MNSIIQKIRKINASFVNMTYPQLEDVLGMFLFVVVSINGIAAILAVWLKEPLFCEPYSPPS